MSNPSITDTNMDTGQQSISGPVMVESNLLYQRVEGLKAAKNRLEKGTKGSEKKNKQSARTSPVSKNKPVLMHPSMYY